MLACTMHSSAPSWRIWIISERFFSSLDSRVKITRIFSRTAADAVSSSECCVCLLTQVWELLPPGHCSACNTHSLHKHPKMLALLHCSSELIFQKMGYSYCLNLYSSSFLVNDKENGACILATYPSSFQTATWHYKTTGPSKTIHNAHKGICDGTINLCLLLVRPIPVLIYC